MQQLKIDPKFRDKIPPSKPEEKERLERDILEAGEVYEPIYVWKGTIVDGHNRWNIIQRHPDIKYKIKEMDFQDEWAAIAWMCRKQCSRRNINELTFAKLIQEEHDALMRTHGASDGFRGNQYLKVVSGENNHLPKDKTSSFQARKVVADIHGMKESEVRANVEFGRGLDAAEEAVPGFKEKVLTGEIKPPKKSVAAIRKVEDMEERKKAVQTIERHEPVPIPQKKHPGRPKKDSESDAILQSVISQLKDRDSVREFTVEDLEEDIGAIIQDFLGKVRRSFDIRQDTLKKDGAKERLYTMLEDAKIEITKIEEESL